MIVRKPDLFRSGMVGHYRTKKMLVPRAANKHSSPSIRRDVMT